MNRKLAVGMTATVLIGCLVGSCKGDPAPNSGTDVVMDEPAALDDATMAVLRDEYDKIRQDEIKRQQQVCLSRYTDPERQAHCQATVQYAADIYQQKSYEKDLICYALRQPCERLTHIPIRSCETERMRYLCQQNSDRAQRYYGDECAKVARITEEELFAACSTLPVHRR